LRLSKRTATTSSSTEAARAVPRLKQRGFSPCGSSMLTRRTCVWQTTLMKCPASATEEDDDVQDDHERKGVECCTRERRAARRACAARAAPAPRRAGCSRRTPFFFMSSATELLLRVLAGRSAARSRAVGGVGVRGVRGGQWRSAAVSGVGGASAGGSRNGGGKCARSSESLDWVL
jgi:hypothetical protein